MKKTFITALALCICFMASAQNYPTGLTEMTPEIAKEYRNIKKAVNIDVSMMPGADEAPVTYIDNSTSRYFPAVFSQIGNSCAFASGVGYIYTYEYNALNDLDAKKPENILNYLQVYAFVNGGEDEGGQAYDGWKFIASNGVTTIKDSRTTSYKEWYSGYEAYYNGMDKGVVEYYAYEPDEDGGIEEMKQYLINKGGKASYGGLIQFSAYAHPLNPSLYEGVHKENCDAMIHHFGNDGQHSMTIVGFDDEVGFDYDGNGTIEGAEMGSFICCNSWGEDWGSSAGCKTNKGRFYAPYYAFSTLKQSVKGQKYTKDNNGGGTGNGGKKCLVLDVKNTERSLVAKIKISHDSRNDINLEFGVSNVKGATEPEKFISSKFMGHQGGDLNMRGVNSVNYKEIEFGLNISEFSKAIDDGNATFFVNVKNRTEGVAGKGKLISCSIIDYRGEKPIEYFSVINSSEISGSKTARCATQVGYQDIDKDVDVNVLCNVDVVNKKLTIHFNAAVDAPVQIDIIKSGEVVKGIYNKTIKAGKSMEVLDISSLTKTSYILRIVAGNRFIYNNLKLQ